MDTNGAVDVRQRGLEDKRLLAGDFIVPGRIGNGDHCRSPCPTCKLAPIDAIENPAGRIHSLKKGEAMKSFADQTIEQEDLADWPPDRAGPKRLWKAQYFLKIASMTGSVRGAIEMICTGATVQAEQANLRRPKGIRKPRQRFRPESVVKHGLVDQIYQGLKIIFLGHGKGLGPKSVCKIGKCFVQIRASDDLRDLCIWAC